MRFCRALYEREAISGHESVLPGLSIMAVTSSEAATAPAPEVER